FKHWPEYRDLLENCLTNGTLPSISMGRGGLFVQVEGESSRLLDEILGSGSTGMGTGAKGRAHDRIRLWSPRQPALPSCQWTDRPVLQLSLPVTGVGLGSRSLQTSHRRR